MKWFGGRHAFNQRLRSDFEGDGYKHSFKVLSYLWISISAEIDAFGSLVIWIGIALHIKKQTNVLDRGVRHPQEDMHTDMQTHRQRHVHAQTRPTGREPCRTESSLEILDWSKRNWRKWCQYSLFVHCSKSSQHMVFLCPLPHDPWHMYKKINPAVQTTQHDLYISCWFRLKLLSHCHWSSNGQHLAYSQAPIKRGRHEDSSLIEIFHHS